ncbi:unnamed protein product [Polarella glacialis]|uniref:Uncharacterized protein n=1 Tax=Polarella glacialis TaxID=89957 RepID=A0A813EFW2_POLGL|nr:unnamed protein product [Polarella glacialis]
MVAWESQFIVNFEVHRRAAHHYEYVNFYFSALPSIILGALISFCSIIADQNVEAQPSVTRALLIICASMSAVNVVLTGIAAYWKFQARAEQNKFAAHEYDSLRQRVNFLKNRMEAERVDWVEVLAEVDSKLTEIKKQCGTPELKFDKAYKREMLMHTVNEVHSLRQTLSQYEHGWCWAVLRPMLPYCSCCRRTGALKGKGRIGQGKQNAGHEIDILQRNIRTAQVKDAAVVEQFQGLCWHTLTSAIQRGSMEDARLLVLSSPHMFLGPQHHNSAQGSRWMTALSYHDVDGRNLMHHCVTHSFDPFIEWLIHEAQDYIPVPSFSQSEVSAAQGPSQPEEESWVWWYYLQGDDDGMIPVNCVGDEVHVATKRLLLNQTLKAAALYESGRVEVGNSLKGRLLEVDELFAENGKLVTEVSQALDKGMKPVDASRRSLLHLAAMYGAPEAVRCFLNLGMQVYGQCSVDNADLLGKYPVQLAINGLEESHQPASVRRNQKQIEVVRMLIRESWLAVERIQKPGQDRGPAKDQRPRTGGTRSAKSQVKAATQSLASSGGAGGQAPAGQDFANASVSEEILRCVRAGLEGLANRFSSERERGRPKLAEVVNFKDHNGRTLVHDLCIYADPWNIRTQHPTAKQHEVLFNLLLSQSTYEYSRVDVAVRDDSKKMPLDYELERPERGQDFRPLVVFLLFASECQKRSDNLVIFWEKVLRSEGGFHKVQSILNFQPRMEHYNWSLLHYATAFGCVDFVSCIVKSAGHLLVQNVPLSVRDKPEDITKSSLSARNQPSSDDLPVRSNLCNTYVAAGIRNQDKTPLGMALCALQDALGHSEPGQAHPRGEDEEIRPRGGAPTSKLGSESHTPELTDHERRETRLELFKLLIIPELCFRSLQASGDGAVLELFFGRAEAPSLPVAAESSSSEVAPPCVFYQRMDGQIVNEDDPLRLILEEKYLWRDYHQQVRQFFLQGQEVMQSSPLAELHGMSGSSLFLIQVAVYLGLKDEVKYCMLKGNLLSHCSGQNRTAEPQVAQARHTAVNTIFASPLESKPSLLEFTLLSADAALADCAAMFIDAAIAQFDRFDGKIDMIESQTSAKPLHDNFWFRCCGRILHAVLSKKDTPASVAFGILAQRTFDSYRLKIREGTILHMFNSIDQIYDETATIDKRVDVGLLDHLQMTKMMVYKPSKGFQNLANEKRLYTPRDEDTWPDSVDKRTPFNYKGRPCWFISECAWRLQNDLRYTMIDFENNNTRKGEHDFVDWFKGHVDDMPQQIEGVNKYNWLAERTNQADMNRTLAHYAVKFCMPNLLRMICTPPMKWSLSEPADSCNRTPEDYLAYPWDGCKKMPLPAKDFFQETVAALRQNLQRDLRVKRHLRQCHEDLVSAGLPDSSVLAMQVRASLPSPPQLPPKYTQVFKALRFGVVTELLQDAVLDVQERVGGSGEAFTDENRRQLCDLVSAGHDLVAAYVGAVRQLWASTSEQSCLLVARGGEQEEEYARASSLVRKEGCMVDVHELSRQLSELSRPMSIPHDGQVKFSALANAYAASAVVKPWFESLCCRLAERVKCSAPVVDAERVKCTVHKLKSPFRALEKMILRPSQGPPWDLLRGKLVCSSMQQICAALQALQTEFASEVRIIQVNDRFETPTSSGWSDVAIYFEPTKLRSSSPTSSHWIAELLLVHESFDIIGSRLGGHLSYSEKRLFSEIVCSEPGASKKEAQNSSANASTAESGPSQLAEQSGPARPSLQPLDLPNVPVEEPSQLPGTER